MTREPVVIGVGLRPGADVAALRETVTLCLEKVGEAEVTVLATLDTRVDHPALIALAAEFGVPVTGLGVARLAAQHVADPSRLVAAAVGTPSVAEAAVLALGGDLLVPKTAGDGVTVAVGRLTASHAFIEDPRLHSQPRHPEPTGGTMTETLLERTLAAIEPADQAAMSAALDRQDRLTKPRGSLGQLENVSIRLSGLARACPPPIPEPAAVAVFAADHGVHAQGVSPWPQEVTGQMVANFLAGGAAINAFARRSGSAVVVIDVGVATSLEGLVPDGSAAGSAAELTVDAPKLLPRNVRRGTADLSTGPAMTRDEALQGLETGIRIAEDLARAGFGCLLTGDMGIANTTASAALIAAFTGADPAVVTGRGTGVDDETLARKIGVVTGALALHGDAVTAGDPIEILSALGGLEHAALAGFVLGAAAARVPVVLDGVIAGSAALVARALAPASIDACLAGHRSAEPGHAVALQALGLTPMVDLELRLGEGTGAALALPLVQAAVAALREMATFDSAGVADKG